MTTTLDWPPTLPLPTFEGYGYAPKSPVHRTEMENGEARQRRRFTTTPGRFNIRWRFTDSQFALFEAWVRHKAQEGAVWFNMNLLTGRGLESHEVRFVGQGDNTYDAKSHRGGWHVVTATLDARNRPVISEEALDLMLVEDIDGLLADMASLHDTVHVTLPTASWT